MSSDFYIKNKDSGGLSMALKFRSLKTQQPEPQAPYAARLGRIRHFIERDDFLKGFFPHEHPLLVWEPIHASESLTYRLSLRHKPEIFVVGCAQLFHLNGNFPNQVQQAEFRTSFNSILRTLLFWTDNDEIERRESIRLIDDQGHVEWQAVGMFIHLATKHLPFIVHVREDENILTFIFQAKEIVTAVDIGLNLNRVGIQSNYLQVFTERGGILANEAFRDHLLIQLSRTFFSLLSGEQAKIFYSEHMSELDAKAAQKELRGLIHSPVSKEKQQARLSEVDRLSTLLSQSIERLTIEKDLRKNA
jgi:hypothetical protein